MSLAQNSAKDKLEMSIKMNAIYFEDKRSSNKFNSPTTQKTSKSALCSSRHQREQVTGHLQIHHPEVRIDLEQKIDPEGGR